MASQFMIPDLLITWPWPRVMNDMYDEVNEEANDWVKSLELFAPKQYRKFEACNFSKLPALHFFFQIFDTTRCSDLLGSFIGPLESKGVLNAPPGFHRVLI
jgi:hypothetical protein